MGMNVTKYLLTCIGWVWLVSNSTYSQGAFNQAKMDSLLDIYDQKHQLMLTMALSQNNQVVYKRAIGYAWFQDDVQLPANVDTKFRIGSITKTFTAVMVLQLIEEKKLKLSTTLAKYFPKFPNAKLITIEHLLKHRSGIHNFTDDPGYVDYMHTPKTKKPCLIC
jgi:CubicO group peptidase (beta-lactamase class C family)